MDVVEGAVAPGDVEAGDVEELARWIEGAVAQEELAEPPMSPPPADAVVPPVGTLAIRVTLPRPWVKRGIACYEAVLRSLHDASVPLWVPRPPAPFFPVPMYMYEHIYIYIYIYMLAPPLLFKHNIT